MCAFGDCGYKNAKGEPDWCPECRPPEEAPIGRFEGILRLAGLADGDAPTLADCTGGEECKAGCGGDCLFVGGLDMACSNDPKRSCPDDETCCLGD